METKRIKLTGKEKFLVVRTDRIGDVILSTPVLEAVKETYPHSQIYMLVSPYTKDILKNNPFLDGLILDEKKGIGGFFSLLKEVRKHKFDVAVLLYPTFALAFLLWLSRIKVRIGNGYRAYQLFFNQKIYQHRSLIEKHESEYNLDMLVPLGISPKKRLPKMFLSPEERQSAEFSFSNWGIKDNDQIVVIHPGSGNSALNWPPEKFGLFADKLIEKKNIKIILTGSEKERELTNKVKSSVKNPVLDLTGKTTLRELACLLERSEVIVSGSTGPMHMASALGTPVVALFCPIFVTGPKRWGPLGEGHETILPPVPTCKKCNPESCSYFPCMEKIEVDEVMAKVINILERKTNLLVK